MKRSTLVKSVLLGGTAVTLAACGGGGNSSTSTTPAAPPSLEAQFGAGFNTDFAAMANTDPVTPKSGDIIALTLTAQPVALH